jgi:hypothetical protein
LVDWRRSLREVRPPAQAGPDLAGPGDQPASSSRIISYLVGRVFRPCDGSLLDLLRSPQLRYPRPDPPSGGGKPSTGVVSS